jgi:plastocyanin
MKESWVNSAALAAVLVASAPVWAHEECDEEESTKLPNAAGEAVLLAPTAAKVSIKLFRYEPARLQVPAGATVIWVNEDEIFHSITADKKESGLDGSLDGKGKSFSFTFSQPGIYTYHCDRHEHMRGEIEVR